MIFQEREKTVFEASSRIMGKKSKEIIEGNAICNFSVRSFSPQIMVIILKKLKILPGIFLCTKIFACSKQFWLARKDTQHFFVTQVSSLVLKSRYLLLKIICIRRYPELYVLLFWWFNELIAKIICWNDGPYCTDYAGVCIKKLKNWSSIFFCFILQQDVDVFNQY